MRKMMLILTIATIYSALLGCTAAVIPTTSYVPQNVVRYEHKNSVDMGAFTYEPELRKEVEANQIQFNSLGGSLYINTSVSEMVKRATGLELEKTGVLISELSDVTIGGDVVELKVNPLGGFNTMTWDYTIRYKIFQKKDQKLLFSKEYRIPTIRTGEQNQPRDYAPLVHEMVLSGYDMFIRDREVRALLDVPPLH